MQLTRTERWILSNQYQILEQLATLRKNDDEVSHYRSAQEALGCGYANEYGDLAIGICEDKDILSVDECREVIKILGMFNDIQYAYSQLDEANREGISEHFASEFPGFCGNSEGKQLGYARYFCARPHVFTQLNRPDDLDSHAPLLPLYRLMLKVREVR
ncbi:Uncharacterized protein OS=Vibrio sp. AND4 GN=AND4_07959 PE=4 SV=1: YfbU [Gemmata massiliana]|uniref:Uncharacterized protein n=1 Tax=Gemmata massiliana TaxID=1210884 RepID=A0A6P2CSA6_9BACT|nr:YfbU family protein [Gemmata massiliana]VTR90985.1 Uncharacterized protein OS=Vibrio sp. AND4 GN=AND4_07959 PE=4 SV=1: YfbU [Gemmata massiliana]